MLAQDRKREEEHQHQQNNEQLEFQSERVQHNEDPSDVDRRLQKQLYARQLQQQILDKQRNDAPDHFDVTPAYLQSPRSKVRTANIAAVPGQQESYPRQRQSPVRVPPHKTPPVSPRYFPSEQPTSGVEKFGEGLSTLYGDKVPMKMQQVVQSKSEYKRFLEMQIREKKQQSKQMRANQISEERALMSPNPNPLRDKAPVQVSPAYADHLSSPDAHDDSASVLKARYAAQLREQMRQDEERKKQAKREQEIYDAQFESPAKALNQHQHQLQSPDGFVDGPFGRRRLGGGGDPGGVTDLKYRNNLIRQASEEVEGEGKEAERGDEQGHGSTANAETRRRMVADVYGATGAGVALGFGPGKVASSGTRTQYSSLR